MPPGLLTLLGIAAAAALASVLGGAIAVWRRPTTLLMSSSLGLASGVLIGTIAFEMMPKAVELGSPGIVAVGFVFGFGAVYGLDLFVHHGRLAGALSDQRRSVARFYLRRLPRTSDAAVLAIGTSVEELIEGLAIGASTVVDPRLGMLVALAIAIDNLSEGLSLGELIRDESAAGGRTPTREIMGWTSTIGVAVLLSAVVGWLLLRGMPGEVVSTLFALGAGAMFYLSVTDLLPSGEQRQYQESSAIASGVGFLVIFFLAGLTS